MSDFIWPSDLDRAENDELNRVCEYLEEVLDERNEYRKAAEHYVPVAHALAAHVERLRERLGVCRLHACYSIGESDALSVQLTTIREVANEALKETPTTSLDHLKAQWQADALEDLAQTNSRELIHPQIVMDRASELRRQAKGINL